MSEDDPTQGLNGETSFEARVMARLDSIDSRLTARLDSIDSRLTAIEKAPDTRPIWEQALAEILEVKERLGRVEEEVRQVKKDVRQFDRKLDILNCALV